MKAASEIAGILLKLGAVSISPRQPFTWASGLKSPLYCDNRLIISTVTERKRVIDAFLLALEDLPTRPTVLAGTATAGIPHAAWLADRLGLPMVYIRGSEKKHGKQNLIEGRIYEGAQAVVIEDLVSTGGSSIAAVEALRERDVNVLAVVSIFQYGMEKARANFEAANVPLVSLCDLQTLLNVAVAGEYITDQERELVEQWRQNPQVWSDERAAY